MKSQEILGVSSWYNLTDPLERWEAIKNLDRGNFVDGKINPDMIQAFIKDLEDDGVIDSKEAARLRTKVDKSSKPRRR